MLQWYLTSPAVLKVTKNFAPTLHKPESKVVLSSDVTLCWASLATQSHSTVCPFVTVTVGGSNLPTVFGSGLSLTTWDAVPLVVPPLGVQAEVPPSPPLELPHAASPGRSQRPRSPSSKRSRMPP